MSEIGDKIQEKCVAFGDKVIKLNDFLLEQECQREEERYKKSGGGRIPIHLKSVANLSNQLLRSGTSIGANNAEATNAISKADFKSKSFIALKEAREETGLKNLKVISDGIYSIQILTVDSHIKKGKFVPSHLHLDCCFLLEANENETLRIKEDENSGVKWVDINKAVDISNENNMKPIYLKLNKKLLN